MHDTHACALLNHRYPLQDTHIHCTSLFLHHQFGHWQISSHLFWVLAGFHELDSFLKPANNISIFSEFDFPFVLSLIHFLTLLYITFLVPFLFDFDFFFPQIICLHLKKTLKASISIRLGACHFLQWLPWSAWYKALVFGRRRPSPQNRKLRSWNLSYPLKVLNRWVANYTLLWPIDTTVAETHSLFWIQGFQNNSTNCTQFGK